MPGTDDDAQRVDYYREALSALVRCLDDGIDVRGYYAWSLLDNFEWLLGFKGNGSTGLHGTGFSGISSVSFRDYAASRQPTCTDFATMHAITPSWPSSCP